MTAVSPIASQKLIAFPTSMIKSPGGILRKIKIEEQPRGDVSTDDSTFESIDSPSSSRSSTIIEAKRFSEVLERQYRQFSDFNINFKSLFSSSVTSTAQDLIAKELNQLPYSFVASLQMRIVLSDSPSFSEEKYSMRSADFKNSQKAKERLYSIILTTFLVKFPKVPSMWNKISGNNISNNISEEMREFNDMMREREIECSFLAIMMNKKYSKALNIVKFKELLIELDPASFSLEWFKEHNKELKKGYRVRFEN